MVPEQKQKLAFYQFLFLVTAFIAQLFFTGEVFTHHQDSNTWNWTPFFTLGAIFLMITFLGGVWIYGWLDRKYFEDIPFSFEAGHQFLSVTAPMIFYLISTIIFLTIGENIFVQIFWLASIILFLARSRKLDYAQPGETRLHPFEWGFILILTALGFGLRYWNLLEIPSHVDNDIFFIGINSLHLIQNSNFHWIGASASGGLIAYDQLIAWSMRLFGANQYGVVMSSVLLGTLTLPIIYLMGREIGGIPVAMISMAFLTFDYTHIHFSRILFGASVTFFCSVAFYYLVKGFRNNRILSYACAGVAMGIGLLFYESGRVMPVIIAFILIGQWLWDRKGLRQHLTHWMALGLGAVLGFGPNLSFAVTQFSKFNGRGNDVMLWSPNVWLHETSVYHSTSILQVLWGQIWRTLLTLQLTGDQSPQFGIQRPMVSAIVAAFAIFGISFCMVHFKSPRFLLLFAWILFTFILGGVFTYDPPFFPHLNIALPAIAIMAGIGALQIIGFLEPLLGTHGRLIINICLAVGICLTGWDNFQTYVSVVTDNAGPRARASRYIQTLPPGYEVYLVDSPHRWDDYIFQFLNRNVVGKNINSDEMLRILPRIDKPSVFLIFQGGVASRDLEKVVPDIRITEHYDKDGKEVFSSFLITPANAWIGSLPPPINPITLPGWWLVASMIIARGSWLVYKYRRVRLDFPQRPFF